MAAAASLIDRRWLNGLNPKETAFLLEWLVDFNGKRAAIAAGYSKKSAGTQAANILARPDVYRAARKCMEAMRESQEMTIAEVQEQLAHCTLRSADDFCDPETGEIITDTRKLSRRAKCAIDGIEQEIHEVTDSEGEVIKTIVKTKLKLVPKASAIDMALKVHGAYAAEKHEVIVAKFDFDKLYQPPPKPVDPVQAKIEQELLARSLLQDVIEGNEDGQDAEVSDAPNADNS